MYQLQDFKHSINCSGNHGEIKMPSTKTPKLLHITFTGGSTNDPVTLINQTTGEIVTKDASGSNLRLESRNKSVVVEMDTFKQGWLVGDVITASIGGSTAGTTAVTLTAGSGTAPQSATVTATAVSTTVINF